MGSSFITRTNGENGKYRVIFDTDNKEHYRMVEDACRAAIDHQKPNVIPVVRCKDCEHYYYTDNRVPEERIWVCGNDGWNRSPDWYCADGERREENDPE